MVVFSDNFKKDHFLSKTDARVKIATGLLLLIMVLSCRSILFPLIVASLSLVCCILMRIPGKIYILRFTEPMSIVFIIVLLKFFFSGSEVVFSIDFFGLNISGYSDGLMEGLMIASRITGAVSIMVLIGFSTPFTELMAGLSWFRIPRGFIEVLMFAYRYIFLLFEEAMTIYHSQKNRLGYSGMRRRLKSFGILAGSLIIRVFDQSQNTTVAMIQRGFNGNMPLLKQKPFRFADVFLSFLFIVTMGIVWFNL